MSPPPAAVGGGPDGAPDPGRRTAPTAAGAPIGLLARPDALLCDLDGTLVDSEAATARVARAWVASIPDAVVDAVGLTFGMPSVAIARQAAPHLDAAAWRRLGDDFDDRLAAETVGVVALPGAAALLAGVGVPVVVVTSSTRRLMLARLAAAGLPTPPLAVCADEVTTGKPGPEPYRRGAEVAGVPASSCAAVEDTPTGVAAARAAGVPVIAVTTTTPAAELASADVVVADLPAALVRLGLGLG